MTASGLATVAALGYKPPTDYVLLAPGSQGQLNSTVRTGFIWNLNWPIWREKFLFGHRQVKAVVRYSRVSRILCKRRLS